MHITLNGDKHLKEGLSQFILSRVNKYFITLKKQLKKGS